MDALTFTHQIILIIKILIFSTVASLKLMLTAKVLYKKIKKLVMVDFAYLLRNLLISLYPLSSVRNPGLSSDCVIKPTPTKPSAISKYVKNSSTVFITYIYIQVQLSFRDLSVHTNVRLHGSFMKFLWKVTVWFFTVDSPNHGAYYSTYKITITQSIKFLDVMFYIFSISQI